LILIYKIGDPDRIRTCNLPLRRGLLYPIEPRGRRCLDAFVLGRGQRFGVFALDNCELAM
jgi:flagellar biosynthesis/type III secretory pathway ATPase